MTATALRRPVPEPSAVPLTLVSFDLCPYVQRAAITLAEKGVPFTRIDVDLADKPDWFKAISPLGRVPLLKVGNEVLFESSVIVEYLEETYDPPLHPADPIARARHRAWMEFGSSILNDVWVVETTADQAAFDTRTAILRDKFARIESVLGSGPFFAGELFSIVDAVFAPVFRYFDLFDAVADLNILSGLPRVAAWRAALKARPSIVGAVAPDYPDRLRRFVKEQGGVLARRIS